MKQWHKIPEAIEKFTNIKNKNEFTFSQYRYLWVLPIHHRESTNVCYTCSKKITPLRDCKIKIIMHAQTLILFQNGYMLNKGSNQETNNIMGTFDSEQAC